MNSYLYYHSAAIRTLTATALTLFLILLISSSAWAQIVLDDGAIIMEAPPSEEICTLEPGNYDANYFVRPQNEADLMDASLQSANIEWTFVSNCGGDQWPAAARAAMEYSGALWGSHLSSSVPIRIRANWADLGGTTLGSAGPTRVIQNFQGAIPNTWYSIAQASAMTGTDYVSQIAGEDFDININMNCNRDNWYYGTDANPGSGEFDFVTVALHEIGHGIGFIGSIQANVSQQTAAYGIGGQPTVYDRFNVDADGVSITDTSEYPNNSNALYQAVTGARGGVFAIGENAVSVNANERVPIFTPASWSPGSSYSHLDQGTYTNTPNALMRPQVAANFAIHSPGPVFCGKLGDWGWPLGFNCADFLDRDVFLRVSDRSVDYGVANVGSPVEVSFVIINDGLAQNDLDYTISIEGDASFDIANPETSAGSVSPGQNRIVRLLYDAVDASSHEAELVITHNAENEPNPLVIPLSGVALPENRSADVAQNYPNPFNMQTTIPFVINSTRRVRIDVFNAQGQFIQTVINEVVTEGPHEVVFDGTGLSSGVYFYRMVSGDYTETKKLLMLK